MQDNFKKYIEENSDGFDHSFDVDKGWNDFSQKNKPRKNRMLALAIAASVALLVGVIGVNFMLDGTPTRELSEWEEVELFYQDQIDAVSVLVTNYSSDETILLDLDEMDKAFDEIKNDLQDDAANEEVIEAMMNHYRLKLEILEKMLDEIRENNEEQENTISL